MEVIDKTNQGSPKTENNMTSEEIKKLATQAVEDVQRSHSRLKEVQDACLHKETEIGLIQSSLRVTCKYCYLAVGYPTPEQAKSAGYTT